MTVATSRPASTPVLTPPAPPTRQLSSTGRLIACLAVLLIALSFAFPLWTLHLTAPQYPETLNLNVYAYKFKGSDNPVLNDIQEINTLNHYIGMAEIHQENFPELKALPVALGASAGILAVAAALASPAILAWGTGLLALTGVCGLGSAYYKLYSYGHDLSPDAAIKVAGFTPPLLGSNRLVNFTTAGMFGVGGLMLFLTGGLLLFALWHSFKRKVA